MKKLGGALALFAIALLVVPAAHAADDPSIQGETRAGVQKAMQEHIDTNTVDGTYYIYDPVVGELLELKLVELHDGIVELSILPTRGLLLRDFALEGGRYCSLRTELAAQLSMRRLDDGSRCTLYVVPVTEALAPVEEGVAERDGVRVELWRDDGRLFALAGPSNGGC